MNVFIKRLAAPFYKQDQNIINDIITSDLDQNQKQLLREITFIKHNCQCNQISAAYNKWKHLVNHPAYIQYKEEICRGETGVIMSNILMHGMSKNKQYEDIMNVFDEMIEQKITPNCHTYKTILRSIAGLKAIDKANEIYETIMNDSNINIYDDITMITSIMVMFGEVGDTNKVNEIWKHVMDHKLNIIITDIGVWNRIMNVYLKANEYQKVLDIYDTLLDYKHPVHANINTYNRCIDACSKLKDIERGKQIHNDLMIKLDVTFGGHKHMDVALNKHLMDMYIKCVGDLYEGIEIWRMVTNMKNNFVYKMMIDKYIDHGDKLMAFQLFDEMCSMDIVPKENTFVSILRACDHKRLVDEMSQYMREIGVTNFSAVHKAYDRCNRNTI